MAWIVGDSFDYYSASLGTADLAHGPWDTALGNTGGFSTGRFNTGQSWAPSSTDDCLVKTFGSNEPTVYALCAHYRAAGLSGTNVEFFIKLRDGTTPQCTIVFISNGSIQLRRGDYFSSTTVATFSPAFAQAVWTHFQFQVVISPTAGSFTVRVNGSGTNTFTATGLNTQSTANSYANSIVLGSDTNPQGNLIDDVLIYSGSGAAPNTWSGDVRAICLYAAQDPATNQFSPFPSAGGTATPGNQSGLLTVPANQIVWTRCTPSRAGTCSTITATAAAAMTGHAQCAVYVALPAGGPGALVATSAAVTNPVAGQAFTFTPALPINAGQPIWIAFLTDTSWNVGAVSTGGYGTYYTLNQAYASGFPTPAPATIVNMGAGGAYYTVNLLGNATCVGEALNDGDSTYVFSSTVNQEDLYNLGTLPITPYAILGVVSKGYMKKSDSGTRQGMLRTRSASTDANGVDTAVSTTYTYLQRVDTVDPATGAAWTLAGVNAFKVGQKVTL